MKEETWHKKVDTAFQKPGYLKKKWERFEDSRQCLEDSKCFHFTCQYNSFSYVCNSWMFFTLGSLKSESISCAQSGAQSSRQPRKTAYKSQITTHIPPTQSALESKHTSVPTVCIELCYLPVFIKYLPTTERYDTKKTHSPYYVIHEIFAENKDYRFFSPFKNKIPRKIVPKKHNTK